MEWPEALQIMVERTKHERFRVLCSADHPDHELHRRRIVEMAQDAPAVAAYPSLEQKAVNLAGAIGRVVAAIARGEPVRVTAEVHASRLSTCRACEHHDPCRLSCTKCGCGALKLELATERCPLDPPRWDRVTTE